MNASHHIVMNVLHENEPNSVSMDELIEHTTGMSRPQIAACLSDLYLLGFVEPVSWHPPHHSVTYRVKLTDSGRAHHLHRLGEDLGDVSDHLVRGAL